MNDITETSEITVTSKANISTTTFNWLIEKFDAICPANCKDFDLIRSPFFTAGEDVGKKSKWYVSISGKLGDIACFVRFDSMDQERCGGTASNNQSVTCHFKMSVGNNVNRHLVTFPGCTQKFTHESSSWGYNKFITVAQLHQMRDALLQNRTLHICVQMEVFGEPHKVITGLSIPFKRKRSLSFMEVFSTDFQELLTNKKQADVEIVCGSKTFHAHKLILSVRSKVFSAMFDSEMKESSGNQVVLSDIDAETFNTIFEYIYTGKVLINESISYTEIIYGAEKYDLPELKQYCFSKLLECVTVDTIGSLALAADSYNADNETKEAVKKYCQSNITTLWKSSSFKKLLKEHPRAFLED